LCNSYTARIFLSIAIILGVSVSVFGVLHQSDGTFGTISSTFSVDGSTPTTFAPNITERYETWLMHQEFFHTELQPGNHTLVINVTDISSGQTYYLDYILYGPTTSTRITTRPQPSILPPLPAFTDNKGRVAGLLIGLIAAAILLILASVYLLRMRLRRLRKLQSAI
jgi:hypothetical protein